MKRIIPDSWLSSRPADAVTLSQDVIDICADIFELTYRVESLAKPTGSDPATEIVRKLYIFDAQRETVKALNDARDDLARVRRKLAVIEGKGFR